MQKEEFLRSKEELAILDTFTEDADTWGEGIEKGIFKIRLGLVVNEHKTVTFGYFFTTAILET